MPGARFVPGQTGSETRRARPGDVELLTSPPPGQEDGPIPGAETIVEGAKTLPPPRKRPHCGKHHQKHQGQVKKIPVFTP